MTKIRFSLNLDAQQKEKLYRDAGKNGFSSPTSYLIDFIEKGGSSVSDSLELRLQLIEKKVEVYSSNQEMQHKKLFTLLERAYKRIYVAYRLVSYILGRSFYIKPGNISMQDLEETNRIIDKEIDHVRKMSEKENQENN
jgi:hypothetical protein